MVGFIVAVVIVVVLYYIGLFSIIPFWIVLLLVLWFLGRDNGKGDEEEDKDKRQDGLKSFLVHLSILTYGLMVGMFLVLWLFVFRDKWKGDEADKDKPKT